MYRFHADSHFIIGAAHQSAGQPCQDYAATSCADNGARAVLCDGCSTGGRTDIGARILALSAMRFDFDLPDREATINLVRESLGLNGGDLLATCVYAGVGQEGGCFCVEGDGVIAVKYRGGFVWMKRFEWLDNTPFYPAYSYEDRARFVAIHGGLDAPRLLATSTCRQSGPRTITEYSVERGMAGIVEHAPELKQIELMAVFSDGVGQIDGVSWEDAVTELLAMKSLAGEFAKRRMIRAMRDMKQRGKGPIDDISFAVIHIEQVPEAQP